MFRISLGEFFHFFLLCFRHTGISIQFSFHFSLEIRSIDSHSVLVPSVVGNEMDLLSTRRSPFSVHVRWRHMIESDAQTTRNDFLFSFVHVLCSWCVSIVRISSRQRAHIHTTEQIEQFNSTQVSHLPSIECAQ